MMRILVCLVLLIIMSVQAFAFYGPPKQVACLSPDGTKVATVGDNCTVVIRDTFTGNITAGFYKPREGNLIRYRKGFDHAQPTPDTPPSCGEVAVFSFSPDGRYLATQRSGEPIILWYVLNGYKVASFGDETYCGRRFCAHVEFSADKRLLLAVGRNPNRNILPDDRITIWDVATRKELLHVRANKNRGFYGFKLSPHRKTITVLERPIAGLAGTHKPDMIRLWDIQNAKELKTFKGDSASYSPCGRFLMVNDTASRHMLWDIKAGRTILYKVHDKHDSLKSR